MTTVLIAQTISPVMVSESYTGGAQGRGPRVWPWLRQAGCGPVLETPMKDNENRALLLQINEINTFLLKLNNFQCFLGVFPGLAPTFL